MPKLITGLCLAALVGCATAQPTYVTKHGLRVFDKTARSIPKEHVEETVAAVVETVGSAHQLQGIDLFLVPHWIEIPQMDGEVSYADGFTNIFDKQLMASAFVNCLFISGLVHEIAHVIHDLPRQVPDWDHEDEEFWDGLALRESELRSRCSEDELARDEALRAEGRPGKAGADGAEPDTPDPDAPADETTADEAPAEDAPTDDAPAEDAPADEAPDGDAPTEETPGGDTAPEEPTPNEAPDA